MINEANGPSSACNPQRIYPVETSTPPSVANIVCEGALVKWYCHLRRGNRRGESLHFGTMTGNRDKAGLPGEVGSVAEKPGGELFWGKIEKGNNAFAGVFDRSRGSRAPHVGSNPTRGDGTD